jgi:GT2 family glycosyltransferase
MTTPPRETPAFTIAIPVWNGGSLVSIAIDSVLGQTYPDWELVVGDNDSTDEIGSVMERYDDPRVRLHRWTEHVGTYENFNRTMELAANQWVIPLGADDRLVPDALATLARAIAAAEAAGGRAVAMALSPCRRVFPDGRPAQRAYYGSQPINDAPAGRYSAADWLRVWAQPGAPPWNIGSVAFSRRALVAAGGAFRPEIGLSADAELMIRIATAGDVVHIARPLLEYTVRTESDGNQRFAANRRAGEPMTPLGAALLSGLAAHEASFEVDATTRRRLRAVVAETHLQRAGQHRILEGGRGRRAALADIARAAAYSPRSVFNPRGLAYACGALLAPTGVIRWASQRLSRSHERPASASVQPPEPAR